MICPVHLCSAHKNVLSAWSDSHSCYFVKVQNAKQVNSALKQKMEGGIEEFKPPEV